jgi:hypothetical protein
MYCIYCIAAPPQLKQVWGNEIVFSCMRVAQNVFATLDILQSKSTGNGSHFYEVNFDVALGTAVPRHNTFSHV